MTLCPMSFYIQKALYFEEKIGKLDFVKLRISALLKAQENDKKRHKQIERKSLLSTYLFKKNDIENTQIS